MRFDPPIFHPNGLYPVRTQRSQLTSQCTLMGSCASAFCTPLVTIQTVRTRRSSAVH